MALWFGAVIAAAVLLSCSGEADLATEEGHDPIAFAPVAADQEAITRAATPLNHNFTVWGYKTLAGDVLQTVFKGYNVKYAAGSAGSSADNSNGYSYVDELHDQFIKYWDFAASEYNLWGATGGTFGADGTTLTIGGLEQSTSEPNMEGKLFSARYHRAPVSREVVQLQFKRPYAKVRMVFYCSDRLESGDVVAIGASTFGPESPAAIVNRGTLTVTYPKTGAGQETYATTNTTTGAALAFGAVELTHTVGTASNNTALAVPAGGTEYYYVVPNRYEAPFLLTTTVEDDPKTATVPAELMNWLPNHTYTYIFKITEAGKKIEFYDVKVDPWKYGGRQEEEWRNW